MIIRHILFWLVTNTLLPGQQLSVFSSQTCKVLHRDAHLQNLQLFRSF